jgi:hypothetical protein
MSCSSAPQRSRSRSSGASCSDSASMSAKARTRSECPRVFRSWALSAATRERIASAARAGSSSMPRSRASRMRCWRIRTFPTRRARANLEGALSGKSRESLRSTARGRSLLDARSTSLTATSEAPNSIAHHHTKPEPDGRSIARLSHAAAVTPDARGMSSTTALSRALSTGRACQREGSGGAGRWLSKSRFRIGMEYRGSGIGWYVIGLESASGLSPADPAPGCPWPKRSLRCAW